MNEKIIFVRTGSGEDEVRNRTAKLSNDIKRALLMVDGTATVAEIMKRASPSLRSMLGDMFAELARGGYIQDKSKVASRLVTPPVAPKKPLSVADELDFTAAYRAPTQAVLDAEAAAEKTRLAADQQAASLKAELEAAQAKSRADEAERARIAADAARVQAEAKARAEAQARAEALRLKAQQDAERLARESAARIKAEQEAAQVKARAEEAERARIAAEAARDRAEAKARAEAQAREEAVKAQAERLAHELAARAKAEREAEEARLREQHHAAEAARKAEQAAEKIRAAEQEKVKLEAELVRLKMQAESEAHERAAAQEQARLEALRAQDAARLKEAQLEEERRAESARLADELSRRVKAEHEAASRAETERHAKEIAEASQKAAQLAIKAEAEARAVAEEKLRLEEEVAALKAQAESEIRAREQARVEDALARAAQEAVHSDLPGSVGRLNDEHAAEQENVFSELDKLTQAATRDSSQWVVRGDSAVTERRKTAAAVQGCDSRGGNNGVPVVERRTTTATVLFFDIVAYTKQSDSRQIEWKQQFNQLVNRSLSPLDAGERIILDTGDGAAIGFLQHPTDALEAAMYFRAALIANKHFDYPDLRVRIGIHLGPVSLVKDMNGQVNMLGDGINSAQRVMSFASGDQIYVSRAYFEFVSSLSDEYKGLFHYRGTQQDKHGREHQVYELLDAAVSADAAVQNSEPPENASDFNFEAFDTALAHVPEAIHTREKADPAGQLLTDAAAICPEELPVEPPSAPASEAPAVQEEPVPQYSEAESMQLAQMQAKKWAEAESRAAAGKEVQDVATQADLPVVKPVARLRRKPFSWGKVLAGLVALLAVLLFVVPMLLPTQNYRVSMEQMLSAEFRQPVHIGHLEGRILPVPNLTLSEVSIGEEKQMQLQQVRANFAFSALYSSVKPISSLELGGVQLRGSALLAATGWLQQLAADPQYPVAQVALSQGLLEADGLQLTDVEGEFKFDLAGKFSQAHLNANGHKLALALRAAPEQKIALSVTLHDSALPLFPNWVFEELTAAGQLGRDELRIVSLDGRIMGGVLSGGARINWRSGWRVQGALVAKAIALQNINKLLAGDMDGTARFQMQADSLAKIADAALFNGTFNVSKGVLNGVDVVETVRLRNRENQPGGRTHFDALSGELAYANGLYRFGQIRINNSMVKANGALTVEKQQLSGVLSADLTMRGGAVALRVEGSTESPSLHVAR